MPVPSPSTFPDRVLRLSVPAVLVLAVAVLSGCAGDGAFVDRQRDASFQNLLYLGESKPDAPSICYNSWKTTPEKVLALANSVCAQSGRVARLVKQTTLDCRLFYPTRANFVCVAPEISSDEYGIGIQP
jgi:hypothetical protein